MVTAKLKLQNGTGNFSERCPVLLPPRWHLAKHLASRLPRRVGASTQIFFGPSLEQALRLKGETNQRKEEEEKIR
jgi:hypothetical protein